MHQNAQQPPPSSPTTTMVLRECGICQSSIYPSEGTTTCPKCGLTFHAECWQENFGCAAYGCEQVDVLKPKEPEKPVEQLPPPVSEPVERLPWNFLLLGSSAIALMVSALTYGIPSAVVAILCAVRIFKVRSRKPILLAAALLALVGMLAGVAISRLWWQHEYTHIG